MVEKISGIKVRNAVYSIVSLFAL